MELVGEYLYRSTIGVSEPLPFPEYLNPRNRRKNDFWITQEGELIYPKNMDDRHLLNTVAMLHRNSPFLSSIYDKCNADQLILKGIKPIKQNKKEESLSLRLRQYRTLWETARVYMIMRYEMKIRGLGGDIL
ncbi:hypothetical protein B14_200050 (plasmid) [Bacillus licheniformis]|uniref:hypothetical protein n=1 Tax=Bacillus licheniformis TaxID=1402 RepID=UPI0009B794D1|nr:hypothetical protein [Bacillus licheniformis]ARC67261.1 hypothetical protein B14_200050 [Bacillus licheniformis]ARW46098.1 hypothetical protein S100141_04878 [Bacillus licheniformis]MDE1421916.1 hypothetical protein [Bacillus licheniformis]MEC0475921.1 hypothetical protein [Bacillus licheniformis]QAS18753.1 hypothetical protein EQJ69_22790 [Bacillus licheniformis]